MQEWLFKLRAASETYLDETRIKFRVIAAEPLNPKLNDIINNNIAAAEQLLANIKA